MRLSGSNLQEVEKVVLSAEKHNSPYIEFMLHSSELMPSGSPYYKDENSIELLYKDLDSLFSFLKNKGYKGICLCDFLALIECGTNRDGQNN